MITNGRVLDDEYVPRTLHHRDGEMDELAFALGPITRGEQAMHGLIFGPTGTGKTCLAKYATDELHRAANINIQHVDCWQDHTRFQVLHRVVNSFDPSVPDRSAATVGSLQTRIETYSGPSFVVILDEAELLDDPNIIRDYIRPRFSMIVIANDETEFYAEVPPPIEGRLRGNPRVRLKPYPLSALVSILHDRAEQGLEPHAVDTEQLETIADHAAGNAREAITILHIAAKQGERERASTITDTMIADAARRAGNVMTDKKIEDLLPHQREVYEVVLESDTPMTTTQVYDEYSQRVSGETRTNRTIRKYLAKLAEYDLIAKEGTTRARTYHSPE